MTISSRCAWRALLLLLALPSLIHGAFIEFDNCLSDSYQNNNPKPLQWVPLFVDAKFETSKPNNLRLTLYGNVTGQQTVGNYPPPSSPSWNDNSDTFGKIANVGAGNKFSTLFSTFDVLSYSAYDAPSSRFCAHLTQGQCPLGPRFYADRENPNDLAAFEVNHEFGSSYQFSTLASTVTVVSGGFSANQIACISTNITPDLGTAISAMLTWLPAAVLILKGVATIAAAVYSPWGSSDIFRWSSNYGRDEDLLRLVTPGFGDCLQYIQFVTLVGSLTLQYPGFFQPAVSKTAWSLLLFNQSWVSNEPGVPSLVDGVYVYSGTYGIASLRQLIGMADSVDVWACMAIWLAVIIAIVLVLSQIGFFSRWVYRRVTNTREQDLRQKNVPFTVGNLIRLFFNFFILPIIALSMFQLVIAERSPTSVVAVAAIVLAVWIVSAAWILWVIFSTRPRTHLFDDMPTVLLYGPLYNTYSDSAAPFAFIPILITFMRGIAFGAAQPSGTAQVIILAICEIILIFTLNGFRPFMGQTSMNAYHTAFAIARLITVILSIPFITSLNVSESSRGWIGYTILLIHGCVLVFGFFLTSAQTLIEVVARSCGVAGQSRGSILNWRMLKKRQDRPPQQETNEYDRRSLGSHPDMLGGELEHSRSLSASSQQLLNQGRGTPSSHRLSGLEGLDNGIDIGDSPNPGYTYVPMLAGGQGLKRDGEMYYRPPRKRTMTNEALNPVKESTHESPSRRATAASMMTAQSGLQSGTDSPRPAFLRDRADSATHSVRTDYAVREVDQYYRGGAGMHEQQAAGRKLKTGPADPEGPAASAQSWVQGLWAGLLGRKRKEKEGGKGFEVVRSSRVPLEMQQGVEMEEKSRPLGGDEEGYRDEDVETEVARSEDAQATAGAQRGLPSPDLNEAREGGRSPVGSGHGYGRGDDGFADFSRSREASNYGLDGASTTDPPPPNTKRFPARTATKHPSASARTQYPALRSGTEGQQPRPQQDLGIGFITSAQGEHAEYDDDDYQNMNEEPHDSNLPRAASRLSSFAPELEPVDLGSGLDIPTFSRFASQRSTATLGRDPGYDDDRPPLPTQDLSRFDTRETLEGNSRFFDDRGDDFEEDRGLGRLSGVKSTGYHRAGDSISRNSFGAEAAMRGVGAEIVRGGSFGEEDGGYVRRGSGF